MYEYGTAVSHRFHPDVLTLVRVEVIVTSHLLSSYGDESWMAQGTAAGGLAAARTRSLCKSATRPSIE
eukprot:scaffold171035_cov19-Prasinocladus_malaysianus.AAC.1